MTLAVSITLPPPKATMASQRSASNTATPRSTIGIGASAVTSSNTAHSTPAAASAPVSVSAKPRRVITLSVTSNKRRWPPAIASPRRCAEPGPTSSTGWGTGMRRAITPAARLSLGRPAPPIA